MIRIIGWNSNRAMLVMLVTFARIENSVSFLPSLKRTADLQSVKSLFQLDFVYLAMILAINFNWL